jgi:N-acetylneuraminic acid mutarotase
MKQLFLTFLIVITLNNYSNAQYAWTQKSDFAGAKRYAGISFDINGRGYFGTGADFSISTSTIYSDFWQYNPQTDTWSSLTSYPGVPVFGATGFSIQQSGYVGLGWASMTGAPKDDFYIFNPATNGWTATTPFPGGARYTAIGVNSINKGYVGFGFSPWYNDMYQFDAATQTWVQTPSCPGPARQSSEGFALDHLVYVGGGSTNQSTTQKDFWEYNTNSQTWTQVADYPHPVYSAVSFILNGDGFVGCGRTASTHFNDFYSYNYSTNIWSTIPSLPSTAREHASGFSIGNKAYVMCGRGPNNVYLKDVWELGLSTGIDDLSALEAELKLYGNGSNQLVIDFNPINNYHYRLRIFDITGKLIQQLALQGEMQESITIQTHQPIIYHLDRPGNKEVLSGKVLVI